MFDQSGQASIRNYDAQLAAAISISNRNLRACNKGLSETDCMEVRALYWKFQIAGVTIRGLKALPDTLEGFCSRYEISAADQRHLIERVARDSIAEVEKSDLIPSGAKQGVIDGLDIQAQKRLNVSLE